MNTLLQKPWNWTPEILVVGDSTIRFVKLPGAITYCLSGGKTTDFIELIAVLLDIHPSVLLLYIFVQMMWCLDSPLNFIMKSSLWPVQWSLGRLCILSGPAPIFTRGSERFSRLFSLHSWMKSFSAATGLGFIILSDSFWTRKKLYKQDSAHLYSSGTQSFKVLFFFYCSWFGLVFVAAGSGWFFYCCFFWRFLFWFCFK